MNLSAVVQYLDGYLDVAEHPDNPNALNGLQVDATCGNGKDLSRGHAVSRVAVAVDASLAAIREAAGVGADLLLVHHGISFAGLQPVTGLYGRRVVALLDAGISLYACHLPLDSHTEVGNNILLARECGLSPKRRMGQHEGIAIGWWGELKEPCGPKALTALVGTAVDGPVRLVGDGPEIIGRVGVVTGGGGSYLYEAARLGLDAFVTGEAVHYQSIDATELGIHLLLAGHYKTETFGVRALGQHLEDRFGLPWTFLDLPTGF